MGASVTEKRMTKPEHLTALSEQVIEIKSSADCYAMVRAATFQRTLMNSQAKINSYSVDVHSLDNAI